MADVGRRAGVSAQTVSRYVSGSGYVGEATRAKIASAIAELGYRPHRAAGSLRGRHSGTVGVLTVGELVHGSTQILTGQNRGARDLALTLLVAQVETEPGNEGWPAEVRRAVDHFLSAPVDGIIVVTSRAGVDELLEEARSEVPVINLSEYSRRGASGDPTHSYQAGLSATRHLIECGHASIVHVGGPRTRTEGLERERGYRDAMCEAGLAPVSIGDARDWSPAPGYEAGLAVDTSSFTGVFAANDELALGFLSAMERRGRRAPEDYSIVGVDDMPAARYFSPPLTTVRLDFQQLGRASVHVLHERVREGESVSRPHIAPQLVVRDSAGPPPAS
ncbi:MULTISPECIES: LacI family DNA-binding transcriptional regulator [unclassified Brachybacterium]|uniref:LacI family DNA-binding transcriptional regulator n=1 Tax=unclassified Brachybacterium TaxID=2623841 RepID=UPI00361B42FF